MKEVFLNQSIKFITQYQEYDTFELAKLRYGLEGLYLTITKMIVLVCLALILNIFKEVMLVIVLFNIIRYTGFGFHAEKSWHCLLISSFNFIGIPYVLLQISFSNITTIIICGVCLIHYLLFAPADTKKRPLKNKRKRLIRKVLTISIGLSYTILIWVLHSDYWTSILLSVLIIQMIVISPATYKIFHQPYNNYKWA